MQTHAWNDYQLHSTYINWQVRSEKQNIKIKTNRKKVWQGKHRWLYWGRGKQFTNYSRETNDDRISAPCCIILHYYKNIPFKLDAFRGLDKVSDQVLWNLVTFMSYKPFGDVFPVCIYYVFINYVFLRPEKIKLFVRIMWAKKSRSVYFSLCFLSC